MYMNDCANRAVVREHVVNYLTEQGLPCRKKYKPDGVPRRAVSEYERKVNKVEFKMKDAEGERVVRVYDRKVFGVALKKLDVEKVRLRTGQVLPVPPLIHDLCEYIVENVTVEGIFRKAGSTSRQASIKSKIDGKMSLTTEELDVIDVAAVIKYFLRQLPEPLIPSMYHKLFAACYDANNGEELLTLAALLLPIENLNFLTYLMQFFLEVASFSSENKMTSYNIAVCIAPNIFQVTQFSAEEFSKLTGVTKVLIEHSTKLGHLSTEVQQTLKLPKGFNYVKESSFARLINNVVKGLNFMTC